MTVTEWRELDDHPDVRVLPARAMRKALDTILPEMAAETGGDAARADATADRLDDARVEGAVAIVDGDPVGYCSLFEVGDIGMLAELYVSPARRRNGVGTALVAHLLKQARRLLFRVTCVRVPKGDDAAVTLFEKCGFARDGALVEFAAPADAPG
jgi:GNAT superfamily N-acetyltransferase